MNKQLQANTVSLKTVIKAKDMEDDMFAHIEKWARDTFDSKEKIKDEMVLSIFNYFCRKWLTL